jgi:ornithine carbamoyltransferase
MTATLQVCEFAAVDHASTAAALLAASRERQRAVRSGTARAGLRGKKLGLLCEDADGSDGALLFRRAAHELGAQVTHIRASALDAATPQSLQHTARLLGRLYDAVECQGVAPVLVARLAREASIPFFDGIATDGHPSAALAGMLDDAEPLAERRRFVLQAALLEALA